MSAFKNILLTTDLSFNADAAIPFAVALAKRNNGTIHLFHAFEEDASDALASGVVIGVSAWLDSVRRRREEKVAALAQRIETDFGIKTDYKTARGNPAAQTVQQAANSHADVVVIATHGRTGVAHLALGSVAERVVRLSTTPVLTVRPGQMSAAKALQIDLKTILMPTDFSENAAAAEPYALELAQQYGAKIVLVNVIDESIYYGNIEQSALLSDTQQWLESIRTDAEKRLRAKAGELSVKGGIKVETVAGRGNAAQEIEKIATERHADLVVLSTHGFTGFSHLVFGSIAEKVVRSSKVPVLSIKPQKIEARK